MTVATPAGLDDGGRGRPRWLDGVFAVGWFATVGFHLGQRLTEPREYFEVHPVAFGLVLLAVLPLWPSLSWTRDTTTRGRIATSAFAACVLVATLDSRGAMVLLVLAIGNLVFVVRPWAGALLVLAFVATQVWAYLGTDFPWSHVMITVGFQAQFYGTAVVAAEYVRRGREEHRRGLGLLAELAEANAALRASSDRVAELTVAAERMRLSREIHDVVGQHLVAATLTLRLVPSSARSRELDLGRRLVADALDETRRCVRALRPRALEDASLEDALNRVIDLFRTGTRAVRLGFDTRAEALGEERRVVVLRTAQEALTNVVRHSNADLVRVEVRVADALHMHVIDNGNGVPDSVDLFDTTEGSGLGLLGLRERVAGLGGTAQAGQTPDGFMVRVEVPLECPA